MPDFALAQAAARAEIRSGLRRTPPSISPKFFYDPVGSALFERITRTPEYYLTSTEIGILEDNLEEIASGIGPRAVLAEIAAGSARKARIVLGGLESPPPTRQWTSPRRCSPARRRRSGAISRT